MDKEKLIDKIKNLQGITNDEKADLLGLLRSFKKYGLVWEEHSEEVDEMLEENTHA
jgi:adenine-specific DNA-methyltransferase